MKVICIGDGRTGSGCGPVEGKSGDTCILCGGMLLSEEDLKLAEDLQKSWEDGNVDG